MLRALEEVILPAIDPAQKLAIEHTKLCITNLRMIAAQHDKAYQLAVAELRLFSALIVRLGAATAKVLEPTLRADLEQADAASWANFQVPATDHIESLTLRYRELAVAIIESPAVRADIETHQRVSAMVMAHSAEETLMRRAWMALSGVELNAASLPTIDEIIAPAIAASSVHD
jgi:hypothetical protein